MKYIAYGSNMDRDQMAMRCPNANPIGLGWISGAQLEFYLHATVEKTGDDADWVPVLVWELDEADERSLDRYEGVPSYYVKEQWPVRMKDGSEYTGLIYIMDRIRLLPPEDQYYAKISRAYRELGIEGEIEKVLQPALDRSMLRLAVDEGVNYAAEYRKQLGKDLESGEYTVQ